MKKLCMILLSVMILFITGCSLKKDADTGYEETKEAEDSKKQVLEGEGQDTEVLLETGDVDGKDENNLTKSGEGSEVENQNGTGAECSEESSKKKKEGTVGEKENQLPDSQQETVPATKPETVPAIKSEEASASKSEEVPAIKPEEALTPSTEMESVEEFISKPEKGENTEQIPTPEVVSYSPNTVVNLAIAKCQARGMITTQDNLEKALNEGRITQEEYNEYYPYDGLEGSYYSVFVETDLNTASTISGQPLRSEDAIATYIADMLLLENSQVFNVVYIGVYSRNGTDFYEFRCLR